MEPPGSPAHDQADLAVATKTGPGRAMPLAAPGSETPRASAASVGGILQSAELGGDAGRLRTLRARRSQSQTVLPGRKARDGYR